jgi:hypothetical protein
MFDMLRRYTSGFPADDMCTPSILTYEGVNNPLWNIQYHKLICTVEVAE